MGSKFAKCSCQTSMSLLGTPRNKFKPCALYRDQGHFGTPDKSHFGTHREAPVKRHFGTHRRQFGTPTDLWNTRGLGRELRGGWDDNVHLPCTTQVNHQHCYAFLHIPPIRPHTQRRHPHRLLSHAFPPAS